MRMRTALGLALAALGCASGAPPAPRADSQPRYVSRYFEVDAPRGAAWQAHVASAALPFPYERELFATWVAPRVEFLLRPWAPPRGSGEEREPTLEFRADPLDEEPSESAEGSAREISLAGLRWRALSVDDDGLYRRLELSSPAPRAPLSFTVRLCVPRAMPDLVPPELADVIAGFRARPIASSPAELEVERGVGALYELASEFRWTGAAADPRLLQSARAGVARLLSLHPERYEGSLLSAGLAILVARSTVLYGGEAVGPFDYAYQADDGRVETTAAAGDYDAAAVVRDTRAALAQRPDSFWSRYYLAAALQREGELAASESELARLGAEHPESALAWFALALVRRDAGEHAGALEAARRAAEANERQRVFARFGGGLLLGRTLIDRLIRELRGE